jgi:predicted membrane protein
MSQRTETVRGGVCKGQSSVWQANFERKEDSMKSSTLMCVTAMTLFAALAVPARIAPQDQQEEASSHRPTIITFDAPGAGTFAAPCLGQGTFPYLINKKGEIGGNFQDANNVLHGMLRAPDGVITGFDAPGAGTGACQGTQGFAINSEGTIVGKTIDAGNVEHGMLRARDGAVTTFDVQGMGTGSGQGALATSINREGTITGIYIDASNVVHSFLRAPDGDITAVDVPGAGMGAFQGTAFCAVDCVNPKGAIAGAYTDASNVTHGFVRAPDGIITTFDVPGAGTVASPGIFPGTFPGGINREGVIAGAYTDASNVTHGFVRAPDGIITTFDVPGAGTGGNQGTLPTGFLGINPKGTITGGYVDANNVTHGFVRAPDGTITTFDVPGAGTVASPGIFPGTFPLGINAEGAITGYYIDASNVGHGFLRTAHRCEDCEEE